MESSPTDEFQEKVRKLLIRNSNIADILTKCQSACAKTCRSTVRAATNCGCMEITCKNTFPKHDSGINGKLCSQCRSTIENEIGESLFYLASLCNALEISMTDIIRKEIGNVETLGKYSLR